jgi:hypothetical protein
MPILNYNYIARGLVLISLAAYSIAAAWFGQYRFALVGLVIMALFVAYMILDTRDSKRGR